MLKQLTELNKKELGFIALIFVAILVLNLPILFYVRNISYNDSKQKIRLELQQVSKELKDKIFYRVRDSLDNLSKEEEIITLLNNVNKDNHTPNMRRKHVNILLDNTKNILNSNAVYLMNKSGKVVASTNFGITNQTFRGENYGFRPYFKDAIAGANTVYGAVGKTSGERGIYFSTPVRNNSNIKGVLVVKIGLEVIDKILDQFNYPTMILSPQKIVFSSNEKQYMYKLLKKDRDNNLDYDNLKDQFALDSIKLLKIDPTVDQIKIEQQKYLLESFNLNIQGWQITSFKPVNGFFYTKSSKRFFVIVLLITLLLGLIILALLVNRFYKIKLEKKLRKFSKIVEQSPLSVVITDLDGTIEYVNKSFEEITGYQREEVIGKDPSVLKSGRHNSEYYQELWETVLSGETWEGEFYNQKKNGDYYWEKELITPLTNRKGEIYLLIGIKENITKEKALKKELKFFAERDKLTQVYNRRAGYKMLKETKAEADSNNGCFAIAFIDINNLKKVNDVYGHETGDQLIKNIVEIIKKTTRESDLVFRFGGDEFLIMFNDSDTEEVKKIMNRIQDKLEKINQSGNYNYQMSISYGIENYDSNKKINIDELISKADDKMYQFKQKYKEKHNLPSR